METTCLVIGASSSLGFHLAQRAQSTFGRVIATRRAPATSAEPARLEWKQLDVADDASLNRLTKSIDPETLGAVYYFPGVLSPDPGSGLSVAESMRILQVNVGGLVQIFEAFAPRVRDECHLVAVSSRAAIKPSFDILYAATKSAHVGAVRSLAAKYPTICPYAVAPSTIANSGMYLSMSADVRRRHLDRAKGSLMSPEELADTMLKIYERPIGELRGRTIAIGIKD